MKLFNKKGHAIVEASLVWPLVVLLTAVLISITVFYYRGLTMTCAAQKEALQKADASKHIFGVERVHDQNRYEDTHWKIGLRTVSIEAKAYAIDEAMLVRGGAWENEILGH